MTIFGSQAVGVAALLLIPLSQAFVGPSNARRTASAAPKFHLAPSVIPRQSAFQQVDNNKRPQGSSSTSLQGAIGVITKAGALIALRAGGGGGAAAAAENLAIVASGGAGDVADIVMASYEWCTNLGNPSALVAGAVIATIYENISSGDLDVAKKDSKWVKFGKRATRVLLLSAFALEVLSIFVTTVSGTMLLERTLDYMDEIVPVAADTTPLQFFRENFEFEFLTARITFLQGLLHWLAAIGLDHIVPHGENSSERKMNLFIGGALFSSIGLMISFYNRHMTYYNNYGHMVVRWFRALVRQYIFCWPLRPLSLFYAPAMLVTAYLGFHAFFDRTRDSDFDKNGNSRDSAATQE